MSAPVGVTAPTAEDSSVVRSAEVKAAPVDVLAVMEREARVANAYRRESGADLLAADAAQEAEEARAAVAELIEADKEYDKASRHFDDGRFSDWDGISDESRMAIAERFEAAAVRRAAALARVGGAA